MPDIDRIYLGIDYGERRVGLAVSDSTATIASGYSMIIVASADDAAARIVEAMKGIAPIGVIVGYPVAPDGGATGERCRMVDDFIERLSQRIDLPIYRQDERDSTADARTAIHGHGKRITKKLRESGKLDTLAATVILQRWLDEGVPKRDGSPE